MEMIQKLRDADVEIKASSVDVAEGKDGLEATEEDLLERNPELQGSNERDPKFMIYWLTTTKTYTSTSITGTYSYHSIACTPAGFPFNLCG